MKIMKPTMALAFVAGLLLTSCGNNGRTPATTGTNNADTTKQQPSATTTPAAPAGKTVSGTNVEIHAVGNNMSEMHYDVSEIDAPANTDMKITLVDDATDASMQHNIVIVQNASMDSTVAMEGFNAGMAKNFVPDDKAVIAASKLTKPGEKTTLSFKTPAAGEYSFICTYPGHYQKMHGKLVVK